MKPTTNNTEPVSETGTAVHASDMRETGKALELAVAQIDMSLRDSDRAVESLIDAITAMAGCMHRIEQQLDAHSSQADETRTSIMDETTQSKRNMQQAVGAFQFYDLLSQRLAHVRDSLTAVAEVMHAPDRQHPAMWRELNEKLRSLYSLEQEQIMYQALLSGLSAQQVICQTGNNKQDPCGDIELF